MLGVNSRAETGVMQHYISDSIYGLTLAWITSENSTKQLDCRHLDSIFFAGPYLMLPRLSTRVSTVDRLCPCPVANCCQLLFPANSLLASRYLFRPRRDFKSKNPLSGFAPKQTKESSAWRATHIVLHSYSYLTLCPSRLGLRHVLTISLLSDKIPPTSVLAMRLNSPMVSLQ